VTIEDLGPRYRIRIVTKNGPVERTYFDDERDCPRRARFAAEYVVVTLLPPQFAVPPSAAPAENEKAPSDGGSPPGASAPPAASEVQTPQAIPARSAPTRTEVPVAPPPPTASAPTAKSAPSAKPRRPSFASVEASGMLWAAPPLLGAPTIAAAGVDLRARIGAGWLGFVASAGFQPAEAFRNESGFQGNVLRAPVAAGVRLRRAVSPFEVAGDVAAELAYERYEGTSPHVTMAAWRFAPGLQTALTGSWTTASGIGALLRVEIEWLPFQENLVALPNPVVTKTPAFWGSLGLGLSFSR
jgi:hypothetical protein